MLMTTTTLIEGKPVSRYLGIVTGEAIIGANIFRDLFATVRDIVGGRSATYERALGEAREVAMTEMQARELVICGLATDMCVQLTAGDAFLREFATWVPADCTAAESSAHSWRQMSVNCCCRLRVAWRASYSPYSSRPLLNTGVSGEFRDFGVPSPSTRPPKPMHSPLTLRIGNITRSRKRS